MITRDEAINLIKKYLKQEENIKHSLCLEIILREMAKRLNRDVNQWGLTGLLHNIDYEYTLGDPGKIGKLSSQILEGLLPDKSVNAIKANNYMHTDYIPTTTLDKSLIAADAMIKLIKKTSEEGDSLGGSVRVMASGIVPGLGSYIQWNTRIDSKIAAAMMSIPSAKAISIGKGILAPVLKGSEFHDEIFFNKSSGFFRSTNNAGGLEGGMTNGELLDIRIAFKPIPTVLKGLKSVNLKNKIKETSLKVRSDACAVPSAAVVAEAMLALEITEAIQDKFGRDNIEEIVDNYKNYKKYIKTI